MTERLPVGDQQEPVGYITIEVVSVGEPDWQTLTGCPTCGFDAVAQLPVVLLVGPELTGTSLDWCTRCERIVEHPPAPEC